MTSYQITSGAGEDMGVYEGETPEAAIEAMHRDAGYESSEAAAAALGTTVEALRDGLVVTEVASTDEGEETMTNTKTCACGEIVAIEGEPANRIHGTHEGRPAWWYGCTRRGHEGTTVAFGGYAPMRVMDYDTAEALDGEASPELIDASLAREHQGGVCAAYLERGVWRYVPDSQVSFYETQRGETIVNVYVEER